LARVAKCIFSMSRTMSYFGGCTKEHTIFCIGFPYPRRNDETLDCVLPEADA
jgi:hypothetical protein